MVFSLPVDAPLLPTTLCTQLIEGLGGADAAIAQHNDRLQPICGVWRAGLAMEIYDLVMDHGQRALHKIAIHIGAATVVIDAPPESFLNINTPEDLEEAQSKFG